MRDDDELLRQMFEREARLVPYSTDSHAALASIEPALRRAALKRASLIAASAVLVLGGGAAAFQAVRVPDSAVSVGARPIPTETVPAITSAPPAVAPVTLAADDDGTTETTAGTAPRRAPSPVVASDVDTDARSTVAPPTTAPATTAPTTVRAVSPAPQPTATPPPPPTTVAPTTVTPTTTVAPVPVTYDTECGVVVADLATTPPTLLEITPREGYEVHVEDPDHGRLTVHLAGHDHECEIHVGAPATEEPHESHESHASNDEPSDG